MSCFSVLFTHCGAYIGSCLFCSYSGYGGAIVAVPRLTERWLLHRYSLRQTSAVLLLAERDGPLFHVDVLDVTFEGCLLGGRVAAERTAMRPLSAVRPHVHDETLSSQRAVVTDFTGVSLSVAGRAHLYTEVHKK